MKTLRTTPTNSQPGSVTEKGNYQVIQTRPKMEWTEELELQCITDNLPLQSKCKIYWHALSSEFFYYLVLAENMSSQYIISAKTKPSALFLNCSAINFPLTSVRFLKNF